MTKPRNTHELEFLPAALEIQETPPSPIGRAIIWVLILLFSVAVIWACVGRVDIVVTAQGKVIPSERIKIIQPLEISTVTVIHVHEGQVVKRGDVLIELDTTYTAADASRLGNESHNAQVELARAKALVTAMQNNLSPVAQWPVAVSHDLLQTQQQLLISQWQQYEARLNGLDSERNRRQAELASTLEQVKKLEATLPLISERAESLKGLAEKKLAPRHTYLKIEQERIEQSQDLAVQRQNLVQLRAALNQLKQQRRGEETDALNKALADLTELKRREQGLNQESIKAEQRNQLQHLISPVDGVVQQLAIHTVGGVVTPAQQLMVVVPNEVGVEVEAVIENKDIGFVREDQIAEVKVDAFPFTKYGTINAKLLSISNDAVPNEQSGLIFTARVLLDESSIRIDEKMIPLSPGMAVTVEVKTGTRKLIEYVLSPLLRYADESVRER